MKHLDGWNYWVDDNGRIRLFMVAEADSAKAKGLVIEKYPQVSIVSGHEVPASVFKMMEVSRSDIVEWVSRDPKQELTPGGFAV